MKKLGWIVLLLVAGAWDPVNRKAGDVEEGNRKYSAGDFVEAEKRYRAAEKRLPKEPALHYDLGAALHRQAQAMPPGPERDQRFEDAEKALRLSLDASDAKLRSKAHYNLGNTLFERSRFADAVEEYKKSLKLDPASEDARYNLELALRLKNEPPPQQQPQPQDQKQDQEQKQDQQPQPQPQDQKQDEQKQDQPPQPQPQDQKQGDPEENKAAAEPRDLTDEDVERKLKELERRSKDLQVKKAAERAQEKRRGKTVKDW
jgi:Ca-activated chloride channel homolog